MKAMVFAAGLGTRLKELTKNKPKCLMEVGGTTLLEHVIDALKSAGVSSIVINVHYLADQIERYIASKNSFGINISLSHEATLLDTGGGLKKVRDFFEGQKAFLIHNADIYTSYDLKQMVDAHNSRRGSIATLGVMRRESLRGLYFDGDSHLTGWSEEKNALKTPAPTDQLLAFSGISIASSELFQYMGAEDVFSIITAFLNAARSTGRVWGHIIQDCEWTDIGTPEQLNALRQKLG